jgi:alpha,alpha-trehalose phosphorylase
VIEHPAYTVEPWVVREAGLDLNILAPSESVFALSNGHIGLRGNLDEGEPFGLPGTYLNSVYEVYPLPYPEQGYGYPGSGQAVINITNGKVIRLLVDDEPLDVRYGTLHDHERVLDMQAGTLTRRADWTSPAGRRVQVTSVRLVSMTHRAIMAISYEVVPVDGDVRVVVQSELVANEAMPDLEADPRAGARLDDVLVSEESIARGNSALMVHRTRGSQLQVASAMDHRIHGPDGTQVESDAYPDLARVTVTANLEPGQRLLLEKFVAYGWSAQRSRSAVHDQVAAALAGARQTGWDGLVQQQRAFFDRYWAGADVEVHGDAEVQQAVRFGLFHVIQAAARAEQRPVPAKGLTGPGYDGHTFWDSEMFVLPALTYTLPAAAADALTWRLRTASAAEAQAQALGLTGTAFPWRTINGEECSGYWPAGTAAFHINADIADAAICYVEVTDDRDFEASTALPLLVSTARLWRSLGQHDLEGGFRIDGVTGPDEYSAIADNNIYTNLMAQRNLRGAVDVVTRHQDQAEALGVTNEESASWRDAADAMVIPYDERLQVHAQSEGFTSHAVWNFAATDADRYPLLLHFPYFDLYRKQVVKQADLILAMHVCGGAFTAEQKARNFNYYEALTVRDSSLSACTQAVLAAEVGLLDLAHDYVGEAALMDLEDLEHNTADGVHIASLAGAWIALVMGFGGLRGGDGVLRFAPRLPGGITHLAFRVRFRGRVIRVDVRPDNASYQILEGDPLTIRHHEEAVEVGGDPVSRPVTPIPPPESPTQPPGRAPRPRHAGGVAEGD